MTTVGALGLNCQGHAAPEMSITRFRFGLHLSDSAPFGRSASTKTELHTLRANGQSIRASESLLRVVPSLHRIPGTVDNHVLVEKRN